MIKAKALSPSASTSARYKSNLPLVLVCENNGYGEYTPFEAVTAGEIPRPRPEVMEVPAETIDGMSV